MLTDDGGRSIHIAIDAASLLHHALSRLPSENRSKTAPSWRLNNQLHSCRVSQFIEVHYSKQQTRPRTHTQSPSFEVNLRKEHTRSYEWMIPQASLNAEPFVEEKFSEAVLDSLGWRAEGLALRTIRV